MFQTKEGKTFRMPHVYALLFGVIILSGIMTYIIPAGTYVRETVNGVTKINPDSFAYVEQKPVPFIDWFTAVPKGFAQSATIIATMLVGSAFLGVYIETGVFQNFINNVLKRANKRTATILMLVFIGFFALRSGFTGVLDGNLVFTPLMIGFALAAGYDVLTGIAIVLIPTMVCFAFAPVNPYTILVAQSIVGLPVYSAFGFRMIVFIIALAITVHHMMRYASRVRTDKEQSLTSDIDVSNLIMDSSSFNETLTIRQKLLIIMLLVTIAIVVFTAVVFRWGLNQMIAILIISGILGGIVAGYDSNKIADCVVKSGKTFYMGALCVVFARAIYVVMADGVIIDTIVHTVASQLNRVNGVFTSVIMLLVQTFINFFIISGSGQASVTMPIMSSLAELLGLTQQTAVTAFQYGDGLSNMIYPTNGLLFAYLGMGGVSFGVYMKFVLPLFTKLFVLSIIAVIAAYSIALGPL
jgi:uncharacterized ion transporter superfamily protein YfcC